MKKNFFTLLASLLLVSTIFVACDNKGEKKPAEDTTAVKQESMEPKMDAPKDVIDVASGSADHTTLVAAIKAAGLVETLKGAGPFTVFAPTNAAFGKLATGTVEGLLKAENKAALSDILTYHVVAGKFTADKITDGLRLKTVNGKDLTFSIKDGKVSINGVATVVSANVETSNGVVHVIDTVLLP